MGKATTATELFDTEVPAALAAHPDKANELNAVFLFKIGGDGGGSWTCDLKTKPPSCTKGENGKPDCTIIVDHEDFKKLISDPNAGMPMFFSGKLKVTGNPMLATKLQKLFALAG